MFALSQRSGRSPFSLLSAVLAAVVPVSAILLVPTPAQAIITGGSLTGGTALGAGGIFVKLTPPLPNPFGPLNSVGNDNFQSPNLFGFDEDQNIVLPGPLSVDVGSSPIPAGTVVASHYIFFDPLQTLIAVGTVDFDADVLGVIASTGNLSSSDFLANTGVNYLNPSARGLEAGDIVTISGPRQIAVNFAAGTPGDYVRVLTSLSPVAAGAPEPSSLAFLTIAAGTGIAWRRHRRTG
jgi:hypothetical protein